MDAKKIVKGIFSDLKTLPRKALKPYISNGKINKNKLAMDAVPFTFLFYFINKYLQGVVASNKTDILEKCVDGFSLFYKVRPIYLPSLKLAPLLGGIAAGVLFNVYMKVRKKNAKQFRHGEEFGSAKWGASGDFDPYSDPNKWYNIPLTASEWLRLTRPEHPKYDRNKNILIIGGSGAGKTRGFVKPSLMQMHSSYILTDPKGYLWIGQ